MGQILGNNADSVTQIMNLISRIIGFLTLDGYLWTGLLGLLNLRLDACILDFKYWY